MADDDDLEITPVAEDACPTDALVDRWWADTIHGSVIGTNTVMWNHLFEAVAELKERLRSKE
jgi:hypothetical protein